ncbi:hypothetical protein D3C76_1390380 [compost metagenome]
MGDVIDRATQGQGASLHAVGAAQHFGAAQPQWFEQFIGCAARAGQRQAVEHRVDTGRMTARRAVDARATDGQLDTFIA